MRRFLLGLMFAILAALPGMADEVPNPAIEAVIGDQITAFRADDLNTAFSFASPMIKGIFGTPENFGAMVKNGYPMVWRPGAVKFTALRAEGASLYQKVVITDEKGAVHLLEYEMIPSGDTWQIDGVQLLQAPDIGA